MQSGNSAATRLKVLVESDPGGLVRVLQFFQARNVIPLNVSAQRLGSQYLQIEIHVAAAELPVDVLRLIVAKVNELPIALCAVVCD
jgi:hypothetical protein